MAHFLIKRKNIQIKDHNNTPFLCQKEIELSPDWVLNISGSNQTYDFFEFKKDSSLIFSFGYVCYNESNSIKDTLFQCLLNFEENNLGILKKKLLGQFIIIIKKNSSLYIINDFLGSRNIFYDSSKNLVTSSYLWAEEAIGFGSDYLDQYKTLEYFALREVKYPTWLGHQTMNKYINWLLPYQYLKINLNENILEVRPITYELDNRKDSNINVLSEKLIHQLSGILERREFINSTIGCSLTGGRDSRLIATLAANIYPNCRYRIAINRSNQNTLMDLKIAKKISKINNIYLDTYEFKPEYHETLFSRLTEDMTPAFNISITPIIISNQEYALTFGGVYGTEIFEPISADNIIKYKHNLTNRIKASINSTEHFLNNLLESIDNQFDEIKRYYKIREADEKDYIRIFQILITARYSSFIISAMAQYGYDFEPYGSYPLVELALQVDPVLWGNPKSLAGDAQVQKTALFKISKNASRVIAYSSFRPVMPFSLSSSIIYVGGYALHLYSWIYRKLSNKNKEKQKLSMPGFEYISNGWYKYYVNKINKYMSKRDLTK